MKLADGREAIVQFELPLPMMLVGKLASSIADTCEAEGYTDVHMDFATGKITAAPPARTGQ